MTKTQEVTNFYILQVVYKVVGIKELPWNAFREMILYYQSSTEFHFELSKVSSTAVEIILIYHDVSNGNFDIFMNTFNWLFE